MILLSHPLGPATPVYKNRFPVHVTPTHSIAGGQGCNQVELRFSNHSGTHVDCPFHFDPNGKKLTDYSPEFWFCRSTAVLRLEDLETTLIEPRHLRRVSGGRDAELILLITGHGTKRSLESYWQEYPGIHKDVSDFLRSEFPVVRFFGFDMISLTSPQHGDMGRLAHRAFLVSERPILLIEDMNLIPVGEVAPRHVLISPLLIESGDGAPCTIWGDIVDGPAREEVQSV